MNHEEVLAPQRSVGNLIVAQRIAEATGASACTVGDDIVLNGHSDDGTLGAGPGH